MPSTANKRSTTDSPFEELLLPDSAPAKKARTSDELQADAMDVDSPPSPALSDTEDNLDAPFEEEASEPNALTHTPHSCPTQPNLAAVTQSPIGKGDLNSEKADLKARLQQLSEHYQSVYCENANPFTSVNNVFNNLSTFTDKSNATMAESFHSMTFDSLIDWDDVRKHAKLSRLAGVLDDDSSTDPLRLLNVTGTDHQRGVAPVSLAMLSHFALRGPDSGAIYAPSFNARSVSLANILVGDGKKPSMKETIYAKKAEKGFLGFDATEMGIVMYSVHSFDTPATSYVDLVNKSRDVGGQPLTSLTKASMEDGEPASERHFHLFANDCCAVPVTKDAFNALRRFLGYSSMIDHDPKLTDLQSILASLAGKHLATIEEYKEFCLDRAIPFPVPAYPPERHALVARAFSTFMRRHVNVFVACWEGNHRFYSSVVFREGWTPTLEIPMPVSDGAQDFQPVPVDSRLNTDVSVRIAMPAEGKENNFDFHFKHALKQLSKTTLRASNTAIKPSFKSFADTFLGGFRTVVDKGLLEYVDINAYLHEQYSTGTHNPDSYVQFRSQAIKHVTTVKPSVRDDPYLEHAFEVFRGTSVTLKGLKGALLNDFATNYTDPVVTTKTHRPYPVAAQVYAHLILKVMFIETNVASIERFMEACVFKCPQAGNIVDMHNEHWIRRHIIVPSLIVAGYLRDETMKGAGWKKMRRTNSTGTPRNCVKKILLLIHSNFIASVFDALSNVGPDPVYDENANPLLAEAVELGVHDCRTWVEVVLDFYIDYLKEYGDAGLSVRAPTVTGQWQGKTVTYDTFALEQTHRPTSLLQDIIDGTVEFNPTGLQRAVQKSRKEKEKREKNDKKHDSSDEGEENSDDAEAEEAGEDSTGIPKLATKTKRLPPLQPAFAELVEDLKQAASDASITKLCSLVSILAELAKVAKVGKQKGSEDRNLTPVAEQYILDANTKAKNAAKKKTVVPDSDQGSASGDHSVEDAEEID